MINKIRIWMYYYCRFVLTQIRKSHINNINKTIFNEIQTTWVNENKQILYIIYDHYMYYTTNFFFYKNID